jgi:hypothetical protein
MGSNVFRHPRTWLRSWTVQAFGVPIRNCIWHSRERRQVVAYSRGMRPAIDYEAARRSRLTRRQFWGTVVRTVGFTATALICSFFAHHVDHVWWFAIRVGLVIGIVTGFGSTVNPYIEYYADNLPERRLGVFGIGLILCGFALQSFQYWLALFDVHLT